MTRVRILALVSPIDGTSLPVFVATGEDGRGLYAVHLARPDAEPLIRAARDGGLPVLADVPPGSLHVPWQHPVTAWRTQQLETRIAELEAVLAELVDLKSGLRDEEYKRRRVAAWQAARDALAAEGGAA